MKNLWKRETHHAVPQDPVPLRRSPTQTLGVLAEFEGKGFVPHGAVGRVFQHGVVVVHVGDAEGDEGGAEGCFDGEERKGAI